MQIIITSVTVKWVKRDECVLRFYDMIHDVYVGEPLRAATPAEAAVLESAMIDMIDPQVQLAQA